MPNFKDFTPDTKDLSIRLLQKQINHSTNYNNKKYISIKILIRNVLLYLLFNITFTLLYVVVALGRQPFEQGIDKAAF